MPRLNFREIAPGIGESTDLDQFEKFAKVFFENVLRGKVTKGPSRGSDGGIDLKVEFDTPDRTIAKLVSCKHRAHSKDSVGKSDEQDICDRLAAWGCTVFVGFYSTIASSGLEQALERLRSEKSIDFEIFNSEDIETLLLSSHAGFLVAKRFFPQSVQNVWPQFISLLQTYGQDDVIEVDGKWIVPAAFAEGEKRVLAYQAEDAIHLANEKAMRDIHAPMYLAAWKDAVSVFPDFFEVPAGGIASAQSVAELSPKWQMEDSIANLRPNERWSLLAVWALVDGSRAREVLKRMGYDPSQTTIDLMSYAWLAHSTTTGRRDILARLFAYC